MFQEVNLNAHLNIKMYQDLNTEQLRLFVFLRSKWVQLEVPLDKKFKYIVLKYYINNLFEKILI